MTRFRPVALGSGVILSLILIATPSAAGRQAPLVHASGIVTVAGEAVDHNSVKIDFLPVVNAKDYRIFDVTNPHVVKYAGMAAPMDAGNYGNNCFKVQADGTTLVFPYAVADCSVAHGPKVLNPVATEIEWNTLGDHQPHTLVVQAVDRLGPVPSSSLYDGLNMPLMGPMGGMVKILGSNAGATNDGHLSINGQGPYTNNPQVIAQSAPFVAQSRASVQPVPSRPDASQIFYDSFDSTQMDKIVQTVATDPVNGTATYSMGATTSHPWTIEYKNVDTANSAPFVMDNHFMDILFDGGSAGQTQIPLHNNHAIMAMSPQSSADLSNGKILHVTMEVDAHESSRRWVAFNLSPASDPLTDWYTVNAPINTSDKALFLQIFPGMATADIYSGPTSSTNAVPSGNHFWGAAGQSNIGGYRFSHFGGNGLSLDNRSRFDLFISTSYMALFDDGQLVQQSAIPGGLGFDHAKIYYSHYLYHTGNDIREVRQYGCNPINAFWFNDVSTGTPAGPGPIASNDTQENTNACGVSYPAGFGFPYSDERHWGNMGFEVLPSGANPGADWSSFGSVVQPASVEPVSAASPTGVATSTPKSTQAATSVGRVSPTQLPAATKVPTVRPKPTATKTPTATRIVTITRLTVSPHQVMRGRVATLGLVARSTRTLAHVTVSLEIYRLGTLHGLPLVMKKLETNLSFKPGKMLEASYNWHVPGTLAPGRYVLKARILDARQVHVFASDSKGAVFTIVKQPRVILTVTTPPLLIG